MRLAFSFYTPNRKHNTMAIGKQFSFKLTGKTPIIIHADNVEQADQLEQWRKDTNNKKNSKAGDDRSPPWTWMTYLYRGTEYLVVPSDNLSRSLTLAATQVTLKKSKTFKEVSQAGLRMLQTEMVIIGPKGPVSLASLNGLFDAKFAEHAARAKELGFRIDVRRAAIGKSKHVRARPCFDTWELNGKIEITAPEISDEHLAQFFAIAGDYKGLCEWRPGGKTPGPYGTFSTELTPLN